MQVCDVRSKLGQGIMKGSGITTSILRQSFHQLHILLSWRYVNTQSVFYSCEADIKVEDT